MIPLAVFLIPYALFLIVYFIFVYFNIYHLRHYAIEGGSATAVTIIYLVGTLAILLFSAFFLWQYDWTTQVDFSELAKQFLPSSFITPL